MSAQVSNEVILENTDTCRATSKFCFHHFSKLWVYNPSKEQMEVSMKFIVALLALSLTVSAFACGGSKDKDEDKRIETVSHPM